MAVERPAGGRAGEPGEGADARDNLQEENQYPSNPANLEKELRARYNYKKPGETMVIIIPSSTRRPRRISVRAE